MPPPYLFPFNVPHTEIHRCTGDQTIFLDFETFSNVVLHAASSTPLEMGRTGPLWKTSPPFSPRWTPASPSTRRPPYPSSRAQSWGQTKGSSWSVSQVYLWTSSPTTTQATTEPEKVEDEVQEELVLMLMVALITFASSDRDRNIFLHISSHGLATLKSISHRKMILVAICDMPCVCLVLCRIVQAIISTSSWCEMRWDEC